MVDPNHDHGVCNISWFVPGETAVICQVWLIDVELNISVYTCMCIHIYTHTCTHMYTYAYTYTCTYASVHTCSRMLLRCDCTQLSGSCPKGPLVAAGTGSVSGILLSLLLRQLSAPPSPAVFEPLCPATPELSPLPDLPWDLDCKSFCLGILCGLIAGPLLDLLQALRYQWRRLAVRWLSGPDNRGGTPLYRLVYER